MNPRSFGSGGTCGQETAWNYTKSSIAIISERTTAVDGEITATENGFSVYNKKYGTLYYEGATVPNVSTGVKGTPISTATGNTLKITVIDKDGNYINPIFIFSD